MKIAGSYTLHAPRERVWPLIFAPNALLSLIPGCQQLEQTSPAEYRGRIRMGLAALGGDYDTLVRVVEREAPGRCRLQGEVRGPGGIVQGEVAFNLLEVSGDTFVQYEGEALVTGALAKLNPRFVEGVAAMLVGQALTRLDEQLAAEGEAGASAPRITDQA